MKSNKVWGTAACLLTCFALAGCGGGEKAADSGTGQGSSSSAPASTMPSEPVTINMYIQDVTITDDEFKQYIADPVKAKYPYMTVNLLRRPAGLTLEQVIQQMDFDMIYEGSQTIAQFIVNKYAQDLNEYVKKEKIDLSKFEPTYLKGLQNYGVNGELYAMPLSLDFTAMFYNKDIFDKFAVPYPKDGMTWDDLKDVMIKTARKDNGRQYQGLSVPTYVDVFASPYAFDVYDEKTGKPVIVTDGWQKVFEMFKFFRTYPGNEEQGGNPFDSFVVDQNVAMYAGDKGGNVISRIEDAFNKGSQLNWDMVTYPKFSDNKDVALEATGHVLLMSSTSKHKDDVARILNLMSQEDVQTKIAKAGRLPSLKNPDIRNHYGENLKVIKGKNMNPVLKQNPAPMYDRTEPSLTAIKLIRAGATAASDYMKGNADVNTALRKVEEAVNKAIEATKK